MKLQQTFLHKSFKLDSHRAHVANNLILRLLKSKEERLLTAFARSLNEVRANGALAGSCRS